MKKPILTLIALLPLLNSLAMAEGGSVGGGTNLVIKENQLTDFVKFRAEFGDKQLLIDPRNFKLPKENSPVYSDIKPLMDRAETLYPGMGNEMEKAFDKPWLVVKAEFAGRNNGERKVISQTDTAVYVSLDWIRKASPAQVREAFFHEGVRNYASSFTDMAYLHKAPDHQSVDDEITEMLTPLLYKKFPTPILAKKIQQATAVIGQYGVENLGWTSPRFVPQAISRAELYATLKAIDGPKMIRAICEDGKGSYHVYHNWKVESAIDELRKKIKQAGMREELQKYSIDGAYLLGSADESTQALLNLLGYVNKYSNRQAVVEYCKGNKFERILGEYDRDQGKLTLEEAKAATRLPDDEDSSNGSAE